MNGKQDSSTSSYGNGWKAEFFKAQWSKDKTSCTYSRDDKFTTDHLYIGLDTTSDGQLMWEQGDTLNVSHQVILRAWIRTLKKRNVRRLFHNKKSGTAERNFWGHELCESLLYNLLRALHYCDASRTENFTHMTYQKYLHHLLFPIASLPFISFHKR